MQTERNWKLSKVRRCQFAIDLIHEKPSVRNRLLVSVSYRNAYALLKSPQTVGADEIGTFHSRAAGSLLVGVALVHLVKALRRQKQQEHCASVRTKVPSQKVIQENDSNWNHVRPNVFLWFSSSGVCFFNSAKKTTKGSRSSNSAKLLELLNACLRVLVRRETASSSSWWSNITEWDHLRVAIVCFHKCFTSGVDITNFLPRAEPKHPNLD